MHQKKTLFTTHLYLLSPLPSHGRPASQFVVFKIPPALWATGGLGACLPKESLFPELLFPQGRGLPLPYPSPWTLDGRIFGSWDHFWRPRALPGAIPKSIEFSFDCLTHFSTIFAPKLAPKTTPNLSENIPKPHLV